MNKTTKASIATAAGVLLLLGGGGTFATWNSAADAGAAATITAGNLDVIADEDGSWSVNGTPLLEGANIADHLVSPGDVLTYTKAMTIVATGGSMEGYVGLSEASILPADEENAADTALAHFLDASAVITVAGRDIITDGEYFEGLAGVAGIEQDITVTATITFPSEEVATDTIDHNEAMNGVVNLQDFTVTISQGTPPAAAE